MSNIIEFKKKPEAAPELTPVEIGPEHYTPEHYRISDLMRYEFLESTWSDRDGYSYQNTLEQHAHLVAFFAAFGFKYDDHAHSAFRAWAALRDKFVPHVVMCLEHSSTWNLVRNGLDAECIAYVEAVARQDKKVIEQYRSVAQRELDIARGKAEEAENTVQFMDVQISVEASMFERGVKKLQWYTALSYSFSPFEKTSSGEFRNDEHDMFIAHAYVCGWSYADIARDKLRLDEVANICIGTLGYHFWQMHQMGDWRWNKAEAGKTFAGCSDKLIRYISACHGKRTDSARKQRDDVWPELLDWARFHPYDRSVFGRR